MNVEIYRDRTYRTKHTNDLLTESKNGNQIPLRTKPVKCASTVPLVIVQTVCNANADEAAIDRLRNAYDRLSVV